jgi:hypothetical protein
MSGGVWHPEGVFAQLLIRQQLSLLLSKLLLPSNDEGIANSAGSEGCR